MRIEHGPPGHKGVTQIMGLSDIDIENIDPLRELVPVDRPMVAVRNATIASWLVGAVLGMDTVKTLSLGAGIALSAVHILNKKKELPPVSSLQGY